MTGEAIIMEQHRLNHYIIIEGVVPQDALKVLNRWLGEMSAHPLTETVWVYAADAGAEESMRRSGDIHDRLRALSPGNDWQPFRILFLEPRGDGFFSHLMPSVTTPDDAELRTEFRVTEE
jgi:hypothetical protein